MLTGLFAALTLQATVADPVPLPGEVQEPLTEEQIECELLPDWDAEICFDNNQPVEGPGFNVPSGPPEPDAESCALLAELRASYENGRNQLESLRRDLLRRGIEPTDFERTHFQPEADPPPPPGFEQTDENIAIYRYTTALHRHRQTEYYLTYWEARCGGDN